MKYAFAGNRDIGSRVLEFLVTRGHQARALLLTDEDDEWTRATRRYAELPDSAVFRGKQGLEPASDFLASLDLDYIIGIHHPYIIEKSLLALPRHGFLNLHPAYLPYNREWHTRSWAILDGTPAGATLHEMSDELDQGDMIHQKQIEISPAATANSLYRRLKDTEFEVFEEAISSIERLELSCTPQQADAGTSHRTKELSAEEPAKLDLDRNDSLRDLMIRRRALSTNRSDEACYF